MTGLARLLTRVIDWFYFPFLRKIMPLQVFRYAVVGGLNVLLGLALFYISNHYVIAGRYINLGRVVIAPHTATLASVVPFTFLAGLYLNRNIAFTRSPLRTRTQIIRYLLSWGGSLALNWALLKLFVEAFHIWNTPAQILATVIITVYSYLMQKYFTFKGAAEI